MEEPYVRVLQRGRTAPHENIVIVEIDDALKTLLECFSSPHSNKKTTANHAAEAELWYLKNFGYHSKDR
ncbi:unnamed protein product [Malus baccata var. baccata]